MCPMLHIARQIPWRTTPRSLFQAVTITSRHVTLTTTASKYEQHDLPCCTAAYPSIASTSTSSAAFRKRSLLARATPPQQCHHHLPILCSHSQAKGGSRRRSYLVDPGGLGDCSRVVGGCFIRAFGGQSVVPWELALFLVEEMKGEGVQPSAVVYTAALAECRWAGEQRHVDYLLDEMKAEGLSIVPGIPGATDGDLPPSQSPPSFGTLAETSFRRNTPLDPPASDATGEADRHDRHPFPAPVKTMATMQTAARTAETALATVEIMWARGEHEPSPVTCLAALDACAAGGQWERALSLVRDSAMAVAGGGDVDADGDNDCIEKDNSVSARVEALALEGRWDEALLLVQGTMPTMSDGGGEDGENREDDRCK